MTRLELFQFQRASLRRPEVGKAGSDPDDETKSPYYDARSVLAKSFLLRSRFLGLDTAFEQY